MILRATHQRQGKVNAPDVLNGYIEDPHGYWQEQSHGHAGRVSRHRDRWAEEMGWREDEVGSHLLDMAGDPRSLAPVHIVASEGSGANELSRLLGSCMGFFDVGEIAFPPALAEALDSDSGAARVVRALHLLYASHLLPHDAIRFGRGVGVVGGARWTARLLDWDPAAFVVHLIRDPRDQVRLIAAQCEHETGKSDGRSKGQLIRNCESIRADWVAYLENGVAADSTIRYETLRDSPLDTLTSILRAMSVELDLSTLDVTTRDGGADDQGGNIAGSESERGRSAKWTATAHGMLDEILEDLAYPFGECLIFPPRESTAKISEIPPGIRLFGWSPVGWASSAEFGAWMAQVLRADDAQVDWLREAPIRAVCARRLKSVRTSWLKSVLDNPRLISLDLESVELLPDQVEILARFGGGLSALAIEGLEPAGSLQRLRRQLPLATIFG